MSLGKDDLGSVVPDYSAVEALVERGFAIIHDLASRGGAKVARSERFLKRLMRRTLRRAQLVRTFHELHVLIR